MLIKFWRSGKYYRRLLRRNIIFTEGNSGDNLQNLNVIINTVEMITEMCVVL